MAMGARVFQAPRPWGEQAVRLAHPAVRRTVRRLIMFFFFNLELEKLLMDGEDRIWRRQRSLDIEL
jgi:hypothetical protein